MERKRRSVAPVVLLCLGELLLAAAVVAGYWVLRWDWLERHAHPEALLPADVDGDGSPELIVVYAAAEGAETNLVEAIDLERGEVLWCAGVPKLGAMPGTRVQAVIAGPDRLAIARGVREIEEPRSELAPPQVSVYDLQTGAPVWSYELPSDLVFCYQSDCAPLALVGDLLLVETRSPETLVYTTIAFDFISGRRLWRSEANRNGDVPIPIGDDFLLVGGQVVVQRASGQSTRLSDVKPIGRIADGRYVASRRESGPRLTTLADTIAADEERRPERWSIGVLSELDGTYRPFERGAEVALLPESVSPWSIDAIYRDRLIDFEYRIEGPGWVESLPVFEGGGNWRLDLPGRYKVIDAIVMFDGGRYDGVVLGSPSTRYMPVVLEDRETRRKRLAVLDLEEGGLVWLSERYRGYDPYHDMGFHDGLYLIPVEYGDGHSFEDRWALLILEAATGRFRGAYRIALELEEWRFDDLWTECLRPWFLMDGRLFCGDLQSCCRSRQPVWSLELQTMTARSHGPGKVVVEDVTAEVEILLGPLARSR